MKIPEIILGIDPGTRILGFGVIRIARRKPELLDFGVVNLKEEEDHFRVLERIMREVSAIVQKHRPDIIAIEAPFYGKNPQVMLKLGRAQGAAISAGLSMGIPVFEYAPRSVKLAVTGKGAASKEQVATMVQRILGFSCAVKYFDATDALAIALCHFYSSASPISRSSLKNIKQGRAPASKSVGRGKRGGSWEEFVRKNPQRTKEGL